MKKSVMFVVLIGLFLVGMIGGVYSYWTYGSSCENNLYGGCNCYDDSIGYCNDNCDSACNFPSDKETDVCWRDCVEYCINSVCGQYVWKSVGFKDSSNEVFFAENDANVVEKCVEAGSVANKSIVSESYEYTCGRTLREKKNTKIICDETNDGNIVGIDTSTLNNPPSFWYWQCRDKNKDEEYYKDLFSETEKCFEKCKNLNYKSGFCSSSVLTDKCSASREDYWVDYSLIPNTNDCEAANKECYCYNYVYCPGGCENNVCKQKSSDEEDEITKENIKDMFWTNDKNAKIIKAIEGQNVKIAIEINPKSNKKIEYQIWVDKKFLPDKRIKEGNYTLQSKQIEYPATWETETKGKYYFKIIVDGNVINSQDYSGGVLEVVKKEEPKPKGYTCESNGGKCKTQCGKDEIQKDSYTCPGTNICCIPKGGEEVGECNPEIDGKEFESLAHLDAKILSEGGCIPPETPRIELTGSLDDNKYTWECGKTLCSATIKEGFEVKYDVSGSCDISDVITITYENQDGESITRRVYCPTPLPFFTFWNIVAVIVVVGAVYFFIQKNKGKKKRK